MKIFTVIISAALCLTSAAAYSQTQQNIVRVGAAYFSIHSDSPSFTSNGPAFLTPQPAGITVKDASTLLLIYTRRLDEHWDADFEIGYPPRHDSAGTGTLAPFGVVATVKQANPTFFVTYNFGSSENKFRPYGGIGINFTHFYDAESTASGDLANGGPTKINLTNSWGLAAKLGATYKLNDRWAVVGSVGVVKVKTDLTATTGSIERKTSIDLRPVVYTLGVAYNF